MKNTLFLLPIEKKSSVNKYNERVSARNTFVSGNLKDMRTLSENKMSNTFFVIHLLRIYIIMWRKISAVTNL